MAESITFPRILYHPTEPSRIFESQEELTAAGPGWVLTPTEAADAAAQGTTPPPPAAPQPPTDPSPPSDDEPPPVRSRR